jgi:hypothetical protein
VRDGLVDHKELRRLAGRFILRTRHLLVNGSRDSGWIVEPLLSRLLAEMGRNRQPVASSRGCRGRPAKATGHSFRCFAAIPSVSFTVRDLAPDRISLPSVLAHFTMHGQRCSVVGR